MLWKIEVDDLQGHTLVLPLQDNSSGYTVKEVEGLDPVKATIVSSSFAQIDGSEYQAARRENRNLLLKIALEPYSGGSSVWALRSALYAYFMTKTPVLLRFYVDDDTFMISGRVESCEAPLFAKDPEVDVSIICFDPNFTDLDYTTLSGHTVATGTETQITNPGTVEGGYLLTVNVNRTIAGFTVTNRRPDGSTSTIDLDHDLVAGDVVKISTEVKNKYITRTRSGSTISILYSVTTASDWGPFWPGLNYFRVSVAGADIPYTIDYMPNYGGL